MSFATHHAVTALDQRLAGHFPSDCLMTQAKTFLFCDALPGLIVAISAMLVCR
jgi:hypothetical protein